MTSFSDFPKDAAIALHQVFVLGMKPAPCLEKIDGFTERVNGELKTTRQAFDFFDSMMRSGLRVDDKTGDIVTEEEFLFRSFPELRGST